MEDHGIKGTLVSLIISFWADLNASLLPSKGQTMYELWN